MKAKLYTINHTIYDLCLLQFFPKAILTGRY